MKQVLESPCLQKHRSMFEMDTQILQGRNQLLNFLQMSKDVNRGKGTFEQVYSSNKENWNQLKLQESLVNGRFVMICRTEGGKIGGAWFNSQNWSFHRPTGFFMVDESFRTST